MSIARQDFQFLLLWFTFLVDRVVTLTRLCVRRSFFISMKFGWYTVKRKETVLKTIYVVTAVALAALATLQPAAVRAQPPAPVRPVPLVDLDRYAGEWFEIARLPNRFQRQCVGDVRASYSTRSDGRLDVVNRCRTIDGQSEARGVARIVDDRTFARLKVRFAPAWLSPLPFVWGDYWIIGLAPDYSWAVIGEPGRDYLWILARSPHLDDASVAAARAAARASGYDVERLVQTSHGELAGHSIRGSLTFATINGRS